MKQAIRHRASSYIFVVMCLAVLSILAILFIKLAILDRHAAYFNWNKQQALAMAQAAVDYATIEIPKAALLRTYEKPDADYQYHYWNEPLPGNDIQYLYKIPYEKSVDVIEKKPSFYYGMFKNRDGSVEFPYSLPKKLAKENDVGQFATLKVIDANAMVNLNSPLGEHFELFLKNVLQYCMLFEPSQTNAVAKAIIDYRKVHTYYYQFSDLYHLVKDHFISANDYQRMGCYFTVHSWGNPKSICYGSSLDALLKETRYPINVNIASKEMLICVLNGIKARSLYAAETSISEETARFVAERIIMRREELFGTEKSHPFQDWNDLEDFLIKLSQSSGQLSANQAALIFANVYPGLRLNKKDPDLFHFRVFDKLDVFQGTTEFSLFSSGRFYIEAIGRVIRNKEEFVTWGKIVTNVKLWETRVATTQEDFERGRKTDVPEHDAWSSVTASRPFDTAVEKHEHIGALFERNPESDKACRYWDESINEPRPDGAYMDQEAGKYVTKDDWQPDGFDLWLKPGYFSTKEILIAEKHEPADGPGHIVTRCAYENGYITLSRTYVINSGLSRPRRECAPTRVFCGTPLYADARDKLLRAGKITYYLIVSKLNATYQNDPNSNIKISFLRKDSELVPFSERFYRVVYGSFGSGHSSVQSPKTYCMVQVETVYWMSGGTTKVEYRDIRVDVTLDVFEPWTVGHITCELCSAELNLYNALWIHIFQNTPNVVKVNRTAEQKEAVNINEFPNQPVQATYLYSRTEYRADIDLEKGCWYHISGRWDAMKVKELTITSKKAVVTGEMQWDLADGPMHVWPLKGELKHGTRYYAPNCTIYQSPVRGQILRYWPRDLLGKKCTVFSGTFNLREWPGEYSGDELQFGNIAWTRFLPEKKQEPKLTIQLKRPYSEQKAELTRRGEYYITDDEGNKTLALNPLYGWTIWRYEYPILPSPPNPSQPDNRLNYQLELIDNSGTFETTIVDDIWLYLLHETKYLSLDYY